MYSKRGLSKNVYKHYLLYFFKVQIDSPLLLKDKCQILQSIFLWCIHGDVLFHKFYFFFFFYVYQSLNNQLYFQLFSIFNIAFAIRHFDIFFSLLSSEFFLLYNSHNLQCTFSAPNYLILKWGATFCKSERIEI